MGRPSRRLLLVASAACLYAGRAGAEDAVTRLGRELATARSFKVRVQAALLLARTRDERAVPALTAALARDKEEVVRALVAKLLGETSEREPLITLARTALIAAGRDKARRVRRAARAALAALEATQAGGGQPLAVAVAQFGDRSGQALPALRNTVRGEIVEMLRRQPHVSLVALGDVHASFVVDGAITSLGLVPRGDDVEVSCVVNLVVSRPSRGIVLVTSGEASLQVPRSRYRPERRVALEEEAARLAAAGAHEKLRAFFARP